MKRKNKSKISSLAVCFLLAGLFLPSSLVKAEDITVPEPIAEYSFDETLGDADAVIRAERYNEDSILVTSPNKLNYENGMVGKALYMDGSIGLNLNADLVSESYTFGYWIKPDYIDVYAPTMMVVTTRFEEEKFLNVTLSTGWNSPCAWTHNGPESERYETGIPNGLIPGEYAYMTIVVDGEKEVDDENVYLTMYINGYNVASGMVPKGLCADTTTYWFGVNNWDGMFVGCVDEISIFDQALNDSQATALYLSKNGDPNATDPRDNEIDWGGGDDDWNDPEPDPEQDWFDTGNEHFSTILEDHFDSNNFLHLNVTERDTQVIYYANEVNPFSLEKGAPLNVYYCTAGILVAISLVILLAIYKKAKTKY